MLQKSVLTISSNVPGSQVCCRPYSIHILKHFCCFLFNLFLYCDRNHVKVIFPFIHLHLLERRLLIHFYCLTFVNCSFHISAHSIFCSVPCCCFSGFLNSPILHPELCHRNGQTYACTAWYVRTLHVQYAFFPLFHLKLPTFMPFHIFFIVFFV
jgi:hypothetical protein